MAVEARTHLQIAQTAVAREREREATLALLAVAGSQADQRRLIWS